MKFYILLLILLLSISTFAYAKNSNNYFICVKENGESDFIIPGFTKRKDCKNKEFKIQLSKDQNNLKVFDSNGVDLGVLVSYSKDEGNYHYIVYNEDLNLLVRYNNYDKIGESFYNFRFENTDCSGRVFVSASGVFPNVLYRFRDNFYTYDKKVDSYIIVRSETTGNDECYNYDSELKTDPDSVEIKKINSIYKPTFPLFIKSV